MSCPLCGHTNLAGSAFCERCGGRQAPVCAACGAEYRSAARFCRGCGAPLAPADFNVPAEPVAVRSGRESSAPPTRPAEFAVVHARTNGLASGADEPVSRRTAMPRGLDRSRTEAPASPLWAASPPVRPSVAREAGAHSFFTGRQMESARLSEALNRVRRGQGVLIEIFGDEGIGKTRLVNQLRAATPEDDPWWFEVAAEVAQRRAPLQFAVDLLLAMLGPTVSGPDAGVLAGALRQILPEEDCTSLARALAGYLRPAGPDEGMEPELRQRLIAQALRRVTEALARRRPIALVLDNLQEADTSSLVLLSQILPALTAVPALIIAIGEPQFTPPWGARAAHSRLSLNGLTIAEAVPLMESFVGGSVDLDTAAFLSERTSGNPLFIETLMRVLVREGYFEDDKGVQRLPLRRYALIPSSLDELYRLQIERLGENVRLALTPATVIGECFTLRQLSELVRTERTWTVPDTLLTGNLEHLLQSDLIEPFGGPGAYRFRHEAIRAVATSLAPPLRASRLHTILGRLLEQELTPWTGRRLQRLAFHFGLGDRAAKGIEFHSRAGEHALSVAAFPEAEAHYLAGLERLAEAGNGQERAALVECLTAGLAKTRAGLGDNVAAEAGFRAALAGSEDPLARAGVLEGLATVLANQWRHQDALFELSQENDALRAVTGEPAVLASLRLNLRRIGLLRELGWYADAEEAAIEALAVGGAYDPRFDTRISPLLQESVARLCAALGEVKIMRRDLSSAADLLARARAIAERLPDRRCLAEVTEQLAHLAWLQGDLDESAGSYRRARDLQLEAGDLRAAALATHNLALVFWRQSRVSDAEGNLLQAIHGLELAGELNNCRAALTNLERVYWYRGDFVRLEALHGRLQVLASEAGWDLARESLLFTGRLAFERGELTTAESRFRAILSGGGAAGDEVALEASLWLAETLLSARRLTEAADALGHGLQFSQERRDPVMQGLAHLGFAALHYVRGEDQAARESAEAAAALASAPDQRLRLGARHLLGRYFRLAGLLAARAEQWDEADCAFRQSLELLESMEAYLEAARTRLVWAETLLAAERRRSAPSAAVRKPAPRIRTLLADALETFRNSGLAPEQEQVQAVLTQL